MEISLPLDQMTLEEKLHLMDVIWADVRQRSEEIPSPSWHEAVLRERRANYEAGDREGFDLDDLDSEMSKAQWPLKELESRRQAHARGEISICDWNDAKHALFDRTSRTDSSTT